MFPTHSPAINVSRPLADRLGKFERSLHNRGLSARSVFLYDYSLYEFFDGIGKDAEAISACDVLGWIQASLAAGRKPRPIDESLRHVNQFYAFENLVWPGRGLKAQAIVKGRMPLGMIEADPKWDDYLELSQLSFAG